MDIVVSVGAVDVVESGRAPHPWGGWPGRAPHLRLHRICHLGIGLLRRRCPRPPIGAPTVEHAKMWQSLMEGPHIWAHINVESQASTDARRPSCPQWGPLIHKFIGVIHRARRLAWPIIVRVPPSLQSYSVFDLPSRGLLPFG